MWCSILDDSNPNDPKVLLMECFGFPAEEAAKVATEWLQKRRPWTLGMTSAEVSPRFKSNQ